MKLIGTTNSQISCIWTTIGKAIEELGNILELETIIYDREDFLQGKIQQTQEEVLFIFEAGTPQHAGYTMAKMKWYYPNSTFVALSSDAIIYKEELRYDQLDYNYVDILLDVEDKALDYVTSKYRSVIGEKWLWTTSQWLLREAEHFYLRNNPVRDIDFICVAILSGEYRQNLRKYLEGAGYKFSNGGGCGHEDNDLHRLFSHYSRSKWTLGTTSHNNPKIRGMKGFRDWIGPKLGAPLIYDNYPQVMGAYGMVVPYYDYNDFSSITRLVESISDEKRTEISINQCFWIQNNTIEDQLYRVIKKHGIL